MNNLMDPEMNKCLRVILSILGIIIFIPVGLFISSFAGVGMLFVPLCAAAWGIYVQRHLRWGMGVALWALAAVTLISFIGTGILSGATWYEVLAAPYGYQIAGILGAPWIVGSLIGNASGVRLTK